MAPHWWKGGLMAALLLALATPAIAHSAPGDLDPSFDSDGKVTTSFSPYPDSGNAVAIAPDGKIVVVGSAPTSTGNEFAVARYNADGSLDTTFDGDGKVTTPVGAASAAEAWAVAIDAGGKIVVAGPAANVTDNDFAVVRYNADGSLDTGFDGDGKVVTAIGTGVDEAWGLAIQPDGKIVLAGSSWNGPVADFALARYNADGGLDTSFDGDGKLTTPVSGGVAVAYGLRVQLDGKIVAAGYSENGTNEDFALARYSPDGSLDTSFDGDGIVTTQVGTGHDQAWAVVLQPDAKIVAGGYSQNGTSDFTLVRYNADGSLDASFDGDGKAFTDFGGRNDNLGSLALQADGKLVAGGYTDDVAFPGNVEFALARYNADGAIDSSFGTGGVVRTSFGRPDYGQGVAIQPDGNIVLAGFGVGEGQTAFAVARYLGGEPASDPPASDPPPSDPPPSDPPSSDSPPSGGGSRETTAAPSAFGANTLVTLKLATGGLQAKGPLKVRVANANGFEVTGRLSGETVNRASISRKRLIKLEANSFRVGARAGKAVRLRLPKALRILLIRKRKLKLHLTARIKDPAGNTRILKQRVTLSARRR